MRELSLIADGGIPALDLALGQGPNLVYLLTNHDFPDSSKAIDEIHKLDPNHMVKINTIAFVGAGDHDTKFKEVLKQIAEESGGTFSSVNADELDDATQPAAPATGP